MYVGQLINGLNESNQGSRVEGNMKLTKLVVKHFELEQKEFGTEVALSNLLWSVAAQQLRDLGYNQIKTSPKAPK